MDAGIAPDCCGTLRLGEWALCPALIQGDVVRRDMPNASRADRRAALKETNAPLIEQCL